MRVKATRTARTATKPSQAEVIGALVSSLLPAGQPWRPLNVPPDELRIDLTLACGQSFRWRSTGPNEWTSVLQRRIISLRQTSDDVHYRWYATDSEADADDAVVRGLLRDYFRLDVPLAEHYRQWAAADANFARHAAAFRGIRMLRQDPVENVFSFICSSCNNIARITQMVDKLCARYGEPVGADDAGRPWHAFPTVAALAADGVEEELRALGLGYRAKYISEAARLILREHGPAWLPALRSLPYAEAHAALLRLPGIGPKVADCICLMSLVRTHAAARPSVCATGLTGIGGEQPLL